MWSPVGSAEFHRKVLVSASYLVFLQVNVVEGLHPDVHRWLNVTERTIGAELHLSIGRWQVLQLWAQKIVQERLGGTYLLRVILQSDTTLLIVLSFLRPGI